MSQKILNTYIVLVLALSSLAHKPFTMPDPAEFVEPDNNLIELPVPSNFPKISVSSLNCNSLNMAAVNKQTRIRKFYGIVSLKSDVILVSDIRMCNKAGISDSNFIKNILSINPYCSYNFYHHSRSSSRGVGILVKNH